jgi:hypothetical protein
MENYMEEYELEEIEEEHEDNSEELEIVIEEEDRPIEDRGINVIDGAEEKKTDQANKIEDDLSPEPEQNRGKLSPNVSNKVRRLRNRNK